jgi:hypothetical protein
MNRVTFHVYQRSGNRWACVGSFVAAADPVSRREALRAWLADSGIDYDKRPAIWSARRA